MALILCGNFFLSALLTAMDLLEHKTLLKEYCDCRVFGGKLGRQSYGTLEYATELQNIWCIAVEEESPDIFPQKFCHKCKCALNRIVSGRLAVLWFSHPRNRHCSVCDHFKNQKKGGRPRKIGFRGQKTLSARFSAVEEKKGTRGNINCSQCFIRPSYFVFTLKWQCSFFRLFCNSSEQHSGTNFTTPHIRRRGGPNKHVEEKSTQTTLNNGHTTENWRPGFVLFFYSCSEFVGSFFSAGEGGVYLFQQQGAKGVYQKHLLYLCNGTFLFLLIYWLLFHHPTPPPPNPGEIVVINMVVFRY